MEVSDLTDKQLEKIFKVNPEWVKKNHPENSLNVPDDILNILSDKKERE